VNQTEIKLYCIFITLPVSTFILFCLLEMSSDFEEYDKPPAPPVRLTSTKYVQCSVITGSTAHSAKRWYL